MNKFTQYFVIAILFWIMVDFTTAFNPDIQDWIRHMPLVWLFYILYPLLFSFLIYGKNWNTKKIFISMLIAGFSLCT